MLQPGDELPGKDDVLHVSFQDALGALEPVGAEACYDVSFQACLASSVSRSGGSGRRASNIMGTAKAAAERLPFCLMVSPRRQRLQPM